MERNFVLENEEQIKKILEVAEYNYYSLALAGVDGEILYVNERFCNFTGLAEKEIVGKNLLDMNDWQNSQDMRQKLAESIKEREIWEGECCNQKKSGRVYWEYVMIYPVYNEANEFIFFSRIASDITEHKTVAKETLEETYSNLDQILESSGNGICITDLSGKILKTNLTFSIMCGIDQNFLIGANSCELVPLPYCGTDECCMLQISLGEARIEREGYYTDKKTGRKKCWLITVNPLYSVNGEWIGFVKTYQDITDKVELQETMHRDLILASNIQKYFIPSNKDDARIIIETMYEPYFHVSGDVIDFGWNDQNNVLYGYVVDVMGHGIATALQTSALRVLFRQTFNNQMLPGEKLEWVNQNSLPYFAEDFFAAAIYFEFDFKKKIVRYSAAGINHFLAKTGKHDGVVDVPGSLLGILPVLYCEEHKFKFKSGDYFCFMTDGLFDILKTEGFDKDGFDAEMTFDNVVNFLRTTANSKIKKDDASAICIYIR
jgi:PAS domain S-box-containing protein